jgi:hypothetical protein
MIELAKRLVTAPSPLVGEGWSALAVVLLSTDLAPSPLVGEGWGEGVSSPKNVRSKLSTHPKPHQGIGD